MVKNIWNLPLFVWLATSLAVPIALGFQGTAMAQKEAPRRGVTVPISLPNLVRGSQRIFLGVVDSVDPATPDLAETRFRFRVQASLKGKVSTQQPLVLRQSSLASSSAVAGEKVIWFLPKDNPTGLSIPLGFYSGDFRVNASGEAVNLNRNRGLWADDASLWDSGECSRDRFLAVLPGNISRTTLLSYLRRADNPYSTAVLPLEFLYAAVLSCLDENDYATYQQTQNLPVIEIASGG